MAKNDGKGKGGKFSLSPDAQESGGGGFGPGPGATAKEHIFGMFDYGGTLKPQVALLVTFERDGEEKVEGFTCGQGWKVSSDGKTIIPRAGQTGLNENSKAGKYLAALRDECGMPGDFVDDDITVLDGIVGTLDRKPLEKVKDSDKAGSVLIYTEVDEAPWESGGKKKPGKRTAKPADDDDSDDDEDEAPKGKSRRAAADDDDDDNTDSGSDDDEDLTELATEALIDALEAGPLKLSKVEGAVMGVKAVKKHAQKKEIAALAATPKFLKGENGWEFDGKTVTLPD